MQTRVKNGLFKKSVALVLAFLMCFATVYGADTGGNTGDTGGNASTTGSGALRSKRGTMATKISVLLTPKVDSKFPHELGYAYLGGYYTGNLPVGRSIGNATISSTLGPFSMCVVDSTGDSSTPYEFCFNR